MTVTDSTAMPFGKHRGSLMKDVPAHYLAWLNEQAWVERDFPDIFNYVQDNMDAIDQEMEDE